MKEIHINEIGKGKLEDLSPNELRALCWKEGIEIKGDIKTKRQLIDLIRKH
jgi:hypothetical protein